MPAVLVIMVGILVIGSAAAIWWWRISAKVSPYGDEIERARAREERARREAEANTHVIREFDDQPARRN